jgi:ribonuclease BN (tRNA processing enzyme)
MQLTVLGSGSTIPHPMRSSSAYWLETSSGTILLDCAASAPMRMAHEGLDWPNLDAVWISHFHMDHCGGIGPLLAGTRHAPQMQSRTKPLKFFGAKGLKDLIGRVIDVNDYRLFEQPFPVEIVEVESLETFEIVAGIEAAAMSTPHTAESHAIRIRDGQTSLVYSADTGFSESLADFAKGADLFILECTFLKDKPAKKHLELPEAISLIRTASPTRAMLTHFYPDWDAVDFATEIAKHDPPGEVIEARDGFVLNL